VKELTVPAKGGYHPSPTINPMGKLVTST
jgi:hypothetical protein